MAAVAAEAKDGVAASRGDSVVRLPKKDAAKGGERRGEGLTDLAPSDETAGIEDERSGATGSSLQSQATNALLPDAPLGDAAGAGHDVQLAEKPVSLRSLLCASFLMSCCNTMQSVLYVPAAVRIAGSEKRAGTLLASLHSTCALIDVFLAPYFGLVTDKIGRRKPLLTLGALLTFSRLMMIDAKSMFTLCLSRVLGYASSSFFSNTIATCILDISTDSQSMAVYRSQDASAKGWGVVVGPWVAGLLAKTGGGSHGLFAAKNRPFVASAALGALCYAWCHWKVKETQSEEERDAFKVKPKELFGFAKLFGKHPMMTRTMLLLLAQDVSCRTGPIFALSTRKMFGWDGEKTGRWIMIYGLAMALAPAAVTPRLIQNFGVRTAMYIEAAVATVGSGLLSLQKPTLFWAALFPYLFCLGGHSNVRSTTVRAANIYIPEMGKGELTGAISSLTSISNMVSPQLHAGLFRYFAETYPAAPFALVTVCNIIGALILKTLPEEVAPSTAPKKADKKAS
jgi:MFS family permease